jgi:hypothetical protein
MTIADALRTVASEYGVKAMKRPSWKGYMKIEDYVAADPSATPPVPESYKLKIVTGASAAPNATETTVNSGTDATAGTGDDEGTYVLAFSDGTWTLPTEQSKQLVVDAQLWAAFVADDWIVGDAAAFEAARTGATGRW